MVDNNLLLTKIQQGDAEALDELVRANIGLVRSVAQRFRDRGTEYEDLVQIGSIGLMRAARSFDFSYGCMFSTYAVPLIIGEIRRFLRDDGLIKTSRGLKSQGAAVMREKESFISRTGREPGVEELSRLCGMSAEELVCALEAVSPVRSLSEKIGDDMTTLEAFVADREDTLGMLTDKIALHEALSGLTPFQRSLIELRYFRELSQEKTGGVLGITQVRVSREEKKILALLRKALP